MAFDRLITKIAQTQNPTVAGLDPKLAYIPSYIKEKCFAEYGVTLEGAAAALLEFNKGLIDALCDIVPAVKPQAAYYEMYGWQGVKALHDTIAYAQEKGMFVITDGKRNDIGATMEAYATAHLGEVEVEGERFAPFGADALTVNGYLGSDGIKPLLKVCNEKDAGIFVLVKTSNPLFRGASGPGAGRRRDHLPGYGRDVRKLGQGAARQIRLLRCRRCGGRHLSRPAGRAAQGHAPHLLPGAGLRRPGRRRRRCGPRF